jgi:hypothetical protein
MAQEFTPYIDKPTGQPMPTAATPTTATEPETGFWDETLADLERKWPQYSGAMAGGVLGARIGARTPVPGGTAIGATIGAGIGAATAKAGQIGYDIIEGKQYTAMEAIDQMGLSASEEAINEMVGMGINKPLSLIANPILKILTPFRKSVTEQAARAYATIKAKAPRGMTPLTIAELTHRPWFIKTQELVSSTLLTFDKMKKYEGARETLFKEMVDDLSTMFGKTASPSELGEMVATVALDRGKEFNKLLVTPLYNGVKLELGDDILIPTRSFTKWAKNEWATISPLKVGEKRAADLGHDLLKTIASYDGPMPFSTLEELAGILKTTLRTGSQSEKRIAGKILGPLERQIERSVGQKSKKALSLLKLARHQAKKKITTYSNRYINRLIDMTNPNKGRGARPQDVLKAIFENKGTRGIQAVKNAIGHDKFQKLKSWHIQQLMLPAKSKVIPTGNTIMQRMYDIKSGMGREAMEAIYSKKELRQIEDVANAFQVAQEKLTAGGGMTMLVQLMQAGLALKATGIVGDILSGEAPQISVGEGAGAAAIIFGPRVLAKVILDPKYSRALVNGIKMPRMTGPALLRFTSMFEKVYDQVLQEDRMERRNSMKSLSDALQRIGFEAARPEFAPFTTDFKPQSFRPEFPLKQPIMQAPHGNFTMPKPGQVEFEPKP